MRQNMPQSFDLHGVQCVNALALRIAHAPKIAQNISLSLQKYV